MNNLSQISRTRPNQVPFNSPETQQINKAGLLIKFLVEDSGKSVFEATKIVKKIILNEKKSQE